MKFVEIYRLQSDGTQKVIAECKQIDSTVEVIGDPMLAMQLNHDGIIDYTSKENKKLFPADGEKFLDQLKHYFKSGYINASDIKEK